MPQILKRTPVTGTEDATQVGRPSKPKHIELQAKHMHLVLTGGKKSKLQAVAAAMLKAGVEHEYVKGGKTKKEVTINYTSTEPTKIFDGCVHPDSV